jgi:SNF2 family DNA or RNA helicase
VIYGDTSMSERMPIVNRFQEGKHQIFIGGLKAAGTGITLTRASTLIFFENDWNPATMSQAEDRLCRIGQKKMVHVIHPVLNGSLDANMVKMTTVKQNVIDKMLDEVPEEMRMKITTLKTT